MPRSPQPICSCDKPDGSIGIGVTVGIILYIAITFIIQYLTTGFGTDTWQEIFFTIVGTIFGYSDPPNSVGFFLTLIIVGIIMGMCTINPAKSLLTSLLFLLLMVIITISFSLMIMGASFNYAMIISSITANGIIVMLFVIGSTLVGSIIVYTQFKPKQLRLIPNPNGLRERIPTVQQRDF